MAKVISEADFAAAVGRPPQDDDLERCNCDRAGQIGHTQCGWNEKLNLPVFIASALELMETPKWNR